MSARCRWSLRGKKMPLRRGKGAFPGLNWAPGFTDKGLSSLHWPRQLREGSVSLRFTNVPHRTDRRRVHRFLSTTVLRNGGGASRTEAPNPLNPMCGGQQQESPHRSVIVNRLCILHNGVVIGSVKWNGKRRSLSGARRRQDACWTGCVRHGCLKEGESRIV